MQQTGALDKLDNDGALISRSSASKIGCVDHGPTAGGRFAPSDGV